MRKMKKDILNISLLLMLCSAPIAGFAQDDDDEQDPPLEYAYNNTLEIFGGRSFNASRYPGLIDKGLGCFGKGIDDGANFQLRFSRFGFENIHWGWFAQFEISPMWGGEYTLQNHAAADCGWSGKDFERENSQYYVCFEPRGGGGIYCQALVGAVYRYDFAKHWSLRPRVGIGYRSMNNNCEGVMISLIRPDNRAEVYQYDFDICDKKGNDLETRARSFAYNTSIQLQFTPRRHMFFSAEIGFSGTIGHLYQRTTVDHYVLGTYPEYGYPNWAEEYEATTVMRVNRVSHMGQFIDFSFGIGWNIGRNQNEHGPRWIRR